MKNIFYAFCLLFCVQHVQAQTDVYNNSQLFILNTTDTVFITGSIFNNVGADLNNTGGNLYVKKDITNNQVNMTTGGGKLFTTGTTAQTVYGTDNFKTHNWIVDNTNNIVLANRIEVGNGTGGNLSFINGKILSGTALQDVFFNAGSTYTGFTDDNHIIGFCSKDGNTNFSFPIGNGVLKADLDIANLTTNTTFQCKYFGSLYSSLAATAPLVSVFDKEYWILDRTSGSSGSNITLKWNDARKALSHVDFTGIRIGHYNGSSWISEGGTGSANTATGTVTSIMVNSYSPFTFASEGSLLPVLIATLNVKATTNCDAVVSWTGFEDGTAKKYVLQKLINNRWININAVAASPAGQTKYAITDFNTEAGNNAYRIATELYNAANHYTEVKSVNINCKKNYVKVFPTVTKNYVNVYLTEAAQVSVLNNNGQVVAEIINAGPGNQQVNLAYLASGLYFITVKIGAEKNSFKVVKD
jgi:hypothetical protein